MCIYLDFSLFCWTRPGDFTRYVPKCTWSLDPTCSLSFILNVMYMLVHCVCCSLLKWLAIFSILGIALWDKTPSGPTTDRHSISFTKQWLRDSRLAIIFFSLNLQCRYVCQFIQFLPLYRRILSSMLWGVVWVSGRASNRWKLLCQESRKVFSDMYSSINPCEAEKWLLKRLRVAKHNDVYCILPRDAKRCICYRNSVRLFVRHISKPSRKFLFTNWLTAASFWLRYFTVNYVRYLQNFRTYGDW